MRTATSTGGSSGTTRAATCTRTCATSLSFWYKALELKIPAKVTMTGGIYLWKDGREVPDTMNVALEHPEEILFSWDSGFGNNALGATEDILGTDGTIFKGAADPLCAAEDQPAAGHRDRRQDHRARRLCTCRTSSMRPRWTPDELPV